ncbi:MAG: ribonuclease Z [Planctomycetota bacterium]|nr:MAG: ribonuclease Z [Planctomycetota bacterium]
MSARELVVLGCGSQVPTRERNHNGYLLRWDGEGLLFDPGEGTQRQFIFAGVAPTAVTRILITHFHGDHCLGLAGMLQRLSLDGVTRPIHLYFPASGRSFIECARRASIYHDRLDLVLHPVHEPGEIDRTDRFRIEAQRLEHPVETFGWRIVEHDGRRFLPERLARHGVQGPAVGELARRGQMEVGGRTVKLEQVSAPRRGQRFAFVMDTRPCAGARTLLEGADLAVLEATFLDDLRDRAIAYGHLTVSEACALAREAGVRRLVLAHFSQRYADPAVIRAAAEPRFPGAIVAEDGLRVAVAPRR